MNLFIHLERELVNEFLITVCIKDTSSESIWTGLIALVKTSSIAELVRLSLALIPNRIWPIETTTGQSQLFFLL